MRIWFELITLWWNVEIWVYSLIHRLYGFFKFIDEIIRGLNNG